VSDCRVNCSNITELLQFNVSRAAQALQEHADLLERMRGQLNQYVSLRDEEREGMVEQVEDTIRSIRSAREGVEKAAREYEMLVGCCLARDDYMEALLGYYLMAGSRRERELLSAASRVVDVSEDIDGIGRVTRLIQEVLVSVSSKVRRGG
jgi:arginine deiminase